MVMWIMAALVLAVSVKIFFILAEDFGWFGTIISGLLLSAIAAFLGALIVAGIAWVAPKEVVNTEIVNYQLRAIDTGSGIEGRGYFLGGGYVNSTRVLNYIIKNPDGSNQLGYVDANDSKVWEDSETNPHMVLIEKSYANEWIVPGVIEKKQTYEFHIPAGSVVESTTITNK